MPQDGYFVLEMAKWNSGTQKRGLERSMIHYEKPNSPRMLVPCESDQHPGIQCTFTKTPVSSSDEIATVRDILRIEGLTFAIAPGSKFEFRTKNGAFKNPPTTRAISTFIARALIADGREISSQTSGIEYNSVTTPAAIDASQF